MHAFIHPVKTPSLSASTRHLGLLPNCYSGRPEPDVPISWRWDHHGTILNPDRHKIDFPPVLRLAKKVYLRLQIQTSDMEIETLEFTVEDVLNFHKGWITSLYQEDRKTDVEIVGLLHEQRLTVTCVILISPDYSY